MTHKRWNFGWLIIEIDWLKNKWDITLTLTNNKWK
jgi:hypothetical protein